MTLPPDNGDIAPRTKDPRSVWTGMLVAGVLLFLLVILFVTTAARLARNKELMIRSLTTHGVLIVQSLEGAARASMRHGLWRALMLQSLVEEMMDHPHVLALAVVGPSGRVLAASKVGITGPDTPPDPLAGLPQELKEEVTAGRPFTSFLRDELVVGRSFEPFRDFQRRDESSSGPPGRDGRNDHSDSEQDRHMGGMGMGPGMGMGMGMGRGLPPGMAAPQGYALVRLSTEAFNQARIRDIKGALLLAGLIFLATVSAGGALLYFGRRRARELARLRREMAETEHLAAVGRLAGSVAHEVRNPLSALRGLVQFLAKDIPPDDRKYEYAQVAVAEVDRLERVVSGLLEYTRPRPPRLLPLDLGESLASVVQLMGDDARAAGVEIAVDAPPNLPPVMADPDQVRQVLLNLVVNGLEALDGRGRLTLSARPVGGMVEVVVADDGPGLPEGDREQAFDPFYSTKERGSGLGLAIARRIARAHGGDLTAGASPQGGAAFTFTLPRSESR